MDFLDIRHLSQNEEGKIKHTDINETKQIHITHLEGQTIIYHHFVRLRERNQDRIHPQQVTKRIYGNNYFKERYETNNLKNFSTYT